MKISNVKEVKKLINDKGIKTFENNFTHCTNVSESAFDNYPKIFEGWDNTREYEEGCGYHYEVFQLTKDEIGIVERGVVPSSMNGQLLCDEKNYYIAML